MVIDKETDRKDPLSVKVKLAEDWLQAYPEFVNTPEGYGVRFHLAEALLAQALKRPQVQQNMPEVQALFARAQRLYEALERSDNDYTQLSRERKLNLIVTRSGLRPGGDVSRLHTFQECYLQAQVEIGTMAEEEKKLPANASADVLQQHEASRQKHFRDVIAALNRALELADAQSPAADLTEARYILAYAYLMTGEPYRAAILGEDLARNEPRSSRAPTAAAYALDAYAELIAAGERAEEPPQNAEADRGRLRSLALDMLRTWPGDPATDVARHQLGAIALKEKSYPEAVALLSRISPHYGAYTGSQYQLAAAALQADKDGVKPPAGQPPYRDQARTALQKIPEPGAGAEPATVQVWLYAKLQLANLLFTARQYGAMEAVVEDVRKRFGEAPLSAEVRKDLQPAVEALPLYAQYGRADTEFRAGHLAEVRKLLDPVVDQAAKNTLPAVKDPSLVRGMLGLALRARVREGDSTGAQQVLSLLLTRSANDLEGTAAIFTELVQQLKTQVDELRRKGPDAQGELDKTVASFTAFLDELAKQPPDKLKPDVIRFLALGYSGLGKHEQAAELLARIPASPAGDADQQTFSHAVRLMYARELRQAHKFDQAGRAIQEILQTDWGKRNLEARKEQIILRQDQGQWAPAARDWGALMVTLKPQIDKSAKLREQYFECYYYFTYCLYQNALRLADPAKKKASILRAANLIVNLEKAQPNMGGDVLKARYDELLQKEDALRQRYEELKKAPR
jgi:hypothetical protein